MSEEKQEIDIKIDFFRYCLHELMLPHQISKDELIWRCNRVVCNSQMILNKYGLPQNRPKLLRLLKDEEYYNVPTSPKYYNFIQRVAIKVFKIK